MPAIHTSTMRSTRSNDSNRTVMPNRPAAQRVVERPNYGVLLALYINREYGWKYQPAFAAPATPTRSASKANVCVPMCASSSSGDFMDFVSAPSTPTATPTAFALECALFASLELEDSAPPTPPQCTLSPTANAGIFEPSQRSPSRLSPPRLATRAVSSPVAHLAALITRLVTDAGASHGATMAAVAIMDMTDELWMPQCKATPQTHFISALRFVLVNMFQRSESPSAWVEHAMHAVTEDQIKRMDEEMEAAVARVMKPDDFDILLKITTVDWDDVELIAMSFVEVLEITRSLNGHTSYHDEARDAYWDEYYITDAEDCQRGAVAFSTAEEYEYGASPVKMTKRPSRASRDL